MLSEVFETPLLDFVTLYISYHEEYRRFFADITSFISQSSISKLQQHPTLHVQKCRPHACAVQRVRHGRWVWGPDLIIGRDKCRLLHSHSIRKLVLSLTCVFVQAQSPVKQS
jgi:hypothetical protein